MSSHEDGKVHSMGIWYERSSSIWGLDTLDTFKHMNTEYRKFYFLQSIHNEENNWAIVCQPSYKVELVGGIVAEPEPN